MVGSAVTRLNQNVMTMYLWHLVPVVIAAIALYWTGLFPDPEIGSARWLALRVVWMALLALVLAILVAIFGRFEQRPDLDLRMNPNGGLVLAAVGAAVLGLAVITLHGFTEPQMPGVPIVGVASYVAALVLLPAAGRSSSLREAAPTREASRPPRS